VTWKRYDAAAKLLLEKGAELETKDSDGRTPLSLAAWSRYDAIVKLLLEKGAKKLLSMEQSCIGKSGDTLNTLRSGMNI
jgi:ankyrin repeat protein